VRPISARDVSFSYEASTPVLEGVSFDLRYEELVGLIGPNGSGKSTLLQVLSGLHPPQRGTALLEGRPVRHWPRRKRAQMLAMVEQHRTVGFDFNVREVAAMGRTAHRGRLARESTSDRAAIDAALDAAAVEELADRSIHALSGGERQRAFLAAALAQEPRVLLLDEPLTHLDVHHQQQFMRILRARAQAGTAVLIAIHDLLLASQLPDRILLLSRGQLRASGPPQEVLIDSVIRDAFSAEIEILRHPRSGAPIVLPWLDD
jgi:iron complex transport system ATP-binding protein